jgi:deoxyribodipyrimidine photo-lyase
VELSDHKNSKFPTGYAEIIRRVGDIEPVMYGSTRNYVTGHVTFLSPYISRGIISTKYIMNEVLNRGCNPDQIEKFIQELAWRDYWQQIWISKGDAINQDLKNKQSPTENAAIPEAIVNAKTGVVAVDQAIIEFYDTGYLHNHLRMYIASIACNMGRSHWKIPAKWMYYHLLDADWASNALSWQWVSGANSNKKYVANQDNINKYCFTNQKGTFLDIPYEGFSDFEIPDVLKEVKTLDLKTTLPKQEPINIDNTLPTCLYNFYNLDPIWKKDILANRILLLEPSQFKDYPVSQKSIDFVLEICERNIDNIQIYVGEFNDLISDYELTNIYYKEHPLSNHYQGEEEPRDWMFDVKGYYPSFFAFWKKCKKQLTY